MIKILRRLSEKFLDKFFYSYMVKLIEEEFEILILLNEGEKRVAEVRMKYLPPIGTIIQLIQRYDHQKFLIEKIEIVQTGSVAHIQGKLI